MITEITLVPLKDDDREQFIKDNQEAFNYGALEEFGRRDDHFEEENHVSVLQCEKKTPRQVMSGILSEY